MTKEKALATIIDFLDIAIAGGCHPDVTVLIGPELLESSGVIPGVPLIHREYRFNVRVGFIGQYDP